MPIRPVANMPPGSISVLSAPNSSMLIPARYKLLTFGASLEGSRFLWFTSPGLLPNTAVPPKVSFYSVVNQLRGLSIITLVHHINCNTSNNNHCM